MHCPSAAELIRVWELGQGRRPWFRGLLLLAPLKPGSTLRQLSAVSLGTRNAHLLRVRALMFGPMLEAIVNCPSCAVPIEFSIDIPTLLSRHPGDCESVHELSFRYESEFGEVRFRLLSSADLEEIEDVSDAAVLQALGACAITGPTRGVTADDQLLAAVGDAALTEDPLADIRLGVACSACNHEWDVPFDVVSFFWKEIDAEVERLFDDVHHLSTTYGWSEAMILTMSAQRRRRYLGRSS